MLSTEHWVAERELPNHGSVGGLRRIERSLCVLRRGAELLTTIRFPIIWNPTVCPNCPNTMLCLGWVGGCK